MRITRGCNKFCTYCVVPYTRGPEVHRPPQNIVDEVKRLADAGVREVTLLGQTINHYHFRHGDGRETSFAELLYQVHEAVPHLPRLRFVTSFPRDFTDEALAGDARLRADLPLPARPRAARQRPHPAADEPRLHGRGSTAISSPAPASTCRTSRSPAISSSASRPRPTRSSSRRSQLVRDCRFKNSFIFKYSPRPGTVAIERFADDVPEDVKRRRNNELLAVQGEISAENNRAMIGRTVQVLVEGESKLTTRKAYPAAPGGVELGWERRGRENDAGDSDGEDARNATRRPHVGRSGRRVRRGPVAEGQTRGREDLRRTADDAFRRGDEEILLRSSRPCGNAVDMTGRLVKRPEGDGVSDGGSHERRLEAIGGSLARPLETNSLQTTMPRAWRSC